MQGSAKETVERLIDASVGRDFGTVLTLLDENWFCQTDKGRIYVGHRGLSDWIRDSARDGYTQIDMIVESIREQDFGHVLVNAMMRRESSRGEVEALPGTWLYHVADDKVTAVVYFRTEAEARQAMSGPARGASPSALVERNLAAYNRRDFADVVALMRPDIRFSSGEALDDVLQGIDALARHLAGFDDQHRDVVIESHELTELEDGFVLVDSVVRVSDRDGDVLDRRNVAYLARVDGGQIAEWIAHPDIETARAAAEGRISAARGSE
jgi:ketosteroid isomerase-like protein